MSHIHLAFRHLTIWPHARYRFPHNIAMKACANNAPEHQAAMRWVHGFEALAASGQTGKGQTAATMKKGTAKVPFYGSKAKPTKLGPSCQIRRKTLCRNAR
jgi:hypothetical protein